MNDFKLSEHAIKVIAERNIDIEWVKLTINNPDLVEIDKKSINLEHRLKVIPDCNDRVLRIICNVETEQIIIVTSFIDRRMKGKLK